MNEMTPIEADTDPLILYVLMRTDLPDYVAGKSMAQANHAGTQFIMNNAQHDDLDEWLQEGGGFGTVIVLGCSFYQMEQRLGTANHVGLANGLIHDPTYPIRDGHKMQTLPVDTCGYVFGRKSIAGNVLFGLKLFSLDG